MLKRTIGRALALTLMDVLTSGFRPSTWKRPSASAVKVSLSGQRPSGPPGRLMPSDVERHDAELGARERLAVFIDQPALDRAGALEAHHQRLVALDVFVLEDDRADQVTILVCEDHQARMAALQPMDLEGIGLERLDVSPPARETVGARTRSTGLPVGPINRPLRVSPRVSSRSTANDSASAGTSMNR